MPKLSIVIPVYDMENKDFYLKRCLESIYSQTFKDYEIIMTECGKAAKNTNEGIKRAKGEYIKILHMDDYLFSPTSLQEIVDEMPFKWLVSGCFHDNGAFRFNEHYPTYNEKIYTGLNTIGAPSVLSFENKEPLLEDENLEWMHDVDWYMRLYDRYGLPTILNEVNVVIGIHPGQSTNLLSNELKLKEVNLMLQKYEK